MAAAGSCLRAVGLQFWARSLQALPALLAPAVLLGLLLGAAVAALLCRCALGPRRRREVRGAGDGQPFPTASGLSRGELLGGVRTGFRGAQGPPGLTELGREPWAGPGEGGERRGRR